jgi:hypothetical protein
MSGRVRGPRWSLVDPVEDPKPCARRGCRRPVARRTGAEGPSPNECFGPLAASSTHATTCSAPETNEAPTTGAPR